MASSRKLAEHSLFLTHRDFQCEISHTSLSVGERADLQYLCQVMILV
jgi:hypothetical protein